MTAASAAGLLVLLAGPLAVCVILFALPQYHRLMLAMMVFFTCYIKKPFYQEIFFQNYRGVDRGFAVTLPDLLFLGFFLYMLLGGAKRKTVWWPPLSTLWWILIGISVLSLPGSLEPLFGWFTVHKMIRAWIFYVVIVNFVTDRETVFWILGGLAAALLFQGLIVFRDKYITKDVVVRSIGTFRHPNTLAMYTDLIAPVLLAVLLTGLAPKKLNSILGLAIIAGIICVIFTKSRAGIILIPAALCATTALSFLMKPTSRKFTIMMSGLLIISLIAALALPRIIRRFENAPKESAETRDYFNIAAEAMARDNLFGVGINQYSLALSETDYYWYVYPDMVDVDDPEEFRESVRGQSRLGTAHHIYWLYAAETGWPGLIVFVLHIAGFWIYGLVAFIRESDPLFKSIFLGVTVSTSFHHLHGILEWIFRQTEVQYLYFVLAGLMVASVRIGREERRLAKLNFAAPVRRMRPRPGQGMIRRRTEGRPVRERA